MNYPKDVTIAVAESCTGGQLSAYFTKTQGASDYFLGGVIAYSNSLKSTLLDISEDSLKEHGAVSDIVAQEMADAVMRISGSDIGISTTGIAGPDGGTSEKPVGLVYIGIATLIETHVVACHFSGDRHSIQQQAVDKAVELLETSLKAAYK